tara:strand:- start:5722 stop:6312 length:591 start_codon:yes stop_codon:yes gene_type:complete
MPRDYELKRKGFLPEEDVLKRGKKPSNEMIRRILFEEYLPLIRNTYIDLHDGALARSSDIYHVRGRLITNVFTAGGSYEKSEIVIGNPIDIIGEYMKDNEFHAFGPTGIAEFNPASHRVLTQLVEGQEYKFPVNGELEFVFQNGVLVPKKEIKPLEKREASPVEGLQDLKEREGFHTAALHYLPDKTAQDLTQHLF